MNWKTMKLQQMIPDPTPNPELFSFLFVPGFLKAWCKKKKMCLNYMYAESSNVPIKAWFQEQLRIRLRATQISFGQIWTNADVY